MLTCREFAHRHASDFLDGQLGARARLGVWFHLARCDYCRRFISQFKKIRIVLRDKPLPSAIIDSAAAQESQMLGEQLADIYQKQKKSPPRL